MALCSTAVLTAASTPVIPVVRCNAPNKVECGRQIGAGAGVCGDFCIILPSRCLPASRRQHSVSLLGSGQPKQDRTTHIARPSRNGCSAECLPPAARAAEWRQCGATLPRSMATAPWPRSLYDPPGNDDERHLRGRRLDCHTQRLSRPRSIPRHKSCCLS